MDITVAQHVLGPVNWTGPGTLRISADSQFIDSDGETILAGTGTANYEAAAITLAGIVGTIAAFVISSTKDSPDNSLATYTGRIYDAAGTFRGYLFTGWMIPITLGSTVTIAQLSIYNATNAPYRTDTGYTRDEVNALIAAVFVGDVNVGESLTVGQSLNVVDEITASTVSATLLNATDGITVGGGVDVFNAAGIFTPKVGAGVASAASITPTGNVFTITGTTTISTIVTTGIPTGTVLFMITTSALTFDEAGNIDVTGATSLTTSANQLVIAVFDGTKWRLR